MATKTPLQGAKVFPNPDLLPPKTKTTLLDDAVAIIKEAVESGHLFSSDHMEVFVDAMLHVLPEGERPWFLEVAEMNHVPKWQALWAQWRRVQEYGVAPALLLDPNWENIDVARETFTHCQWPPCGQEFKADHEGQKFCSNGCGGQAELAAKRAPEETTDGTPLSI